MMNYELIIIMALSYLLGVFTMWVKDECNAEEVDTPPVCHFHPDNQAKIKKPD
jgi:hypothetical protein